MSADRQPDPSGTLRLAVDIGGTFTDAVLTDASGTQIPFKVPTTSADPAQGFMATVDLALAHQGAGPDELAFVAHATTVATNALIEAEGARVALVVTDGFRDILEIARQIRPDLFDMFRDKPTPLVPRDRVFEVTERVGPQGEVITALDPASVEGVASRLVDADVDAVVVCLLHSYVCADHEHAVAERLRAAVPHADVTASADVWPEFREYFRASTAVINAMLRPNVSAYLRNVRASLDARGIDRPVWVMQSGGGVVREEAATELPVQLIESGPAAGLIYAAHLARRLDRRQLVAFEVGGTTAKVGLIVDGEPQLTSEFEVGEMAAVGGDRGRGRGYPVRTPVLDLIEIGAGGGSIAWLDAGGVLRIGPHSAGAVPGPACYQRGGTQPTLTDANLVLGRLDPGRFLGGEMALSPDAAAEALDRRCATPLGKSVEEVARGIVAIATANMARALRLATIERGHDPAEFGLLAFGGAGPLHAGDLAAEVGFDEVIVPEEPGVLSAAGLLVAPVQSVEMLTALSPLDDVDGAALASTLGPLAQRASATLQAQGVPAGEVDLDASADMRYRGQSFELPVSVGDPTAPASTDELALRFHRQHEQAYGYAVKGEPVEVVNWRVTASQPRGDDAVPVPSGETGESTVPTPTVRDAGFGGGEVASYERAGLVPGATLAGPAVVVEAHSTTFVPAGQCVTVDGWRNLVIRRELEETADA